MNRIEIIVASLTAIIILYILVPKEEPYVEPQVSLEEDLPIVAWKDQHEYRDTIRDIVKIKYLVNSDNTKLWVMDMFRRVVHETPFTVSPKKNKPNRIYNYVWKLYETDRTEYIPPGNYDIIVGSYLNSQDNYYLNIEI